MAFMKSGGLAIEAVLADAGPLAASGGTFYDLVASERRFGVLYASWHASTLVWLGGPLVDDLAPKGLGRFWGMTEGTVRGQNSSHRRYASGAERGIDILVKGLQGGRKYYNLTNRGEVSTYVDEMSDMETATFVRVDARFAGKLFASLTARPPSLEARTEQTPGQMTIQLRELQTWTPEIVRWAIGRHTEPWDDLDVDSAAEILREIAMTFKTAGYPFTSGR